MFSLINEGFNRKYLSEEYFDNIKVDVKNVLAQYGYDVNVDGADSYIEAAAEYLDMDPDYRSGNYSAEDWLHDTELNYPEDLEFMKVQECFEECSDKEDVNESLTESGETTRFYNDNGSVYDIVERSKSGKHALLKDGKKWIVAWNCPQSNEGSWGQGHYFFDEDDARKFWEKSYLNEAFDNYSNPTAWIKDFVEDSKIEFKSPESMIEYLEENGELDYLEDKFSTDMASEIYNYFDNLNESVDQIKSLRKRIRECLRKLNEAEISDEDKYDSDILRQIYNKTQQRSNAKLTDEEKAVLDKYGLVRNAYRKNIAKQFKDKYADGGNLIDRNLDPDNYHTRQKFNKANLADRARKMSDRGSGYGYISTLSRGSWDPTDDHRSHRDPETGRWVRDAKDKGLLDAERAAQNIDMRQNVSDMKDALSNRKYHKKELDKNDAIYDKRQAEIEDKYKADLERNERSRKYSGEYHQGSFDRANSKINQLLKRDKNEPLNEAETEDRIISMSISDNKGKEILNSIIGQMSDGIWENSPSVEKYWQNIDIADNGDIKVKTRNGYLDPYYSKYRYNPFYSMSDLEVKKYLANKLKQIVKTHADYNDIDFKSNWNHNSKEECDYLGYKEDITYGDAFDIYNMLRH